MESSDSTKRIEKFFPLDAASLFAVNKKDGKGKSIYNKVETEKYSLSRKNRTKQRKKGLIRILLGNNRLNTYFLYIFAESSLFLLNIIDLHIDDDWECEKRQSMCI